MSKAGSENQKRAEPSRPDSSKQQVVIEEGQGKVVFENGEVFYNEVQIKNRDLSVLVLNAYAKQIQDEAKSQVRRRSRNERWRKVNPTWTTWGPDDGPSEPIPDMKKDPQTQAVPNVDPDKLKVPGLYILEALGASGLRSMRYAKEIDHGCGIDKIVCNDLEVHAYESIRKNAEFNGIPPEKLLPSQGDAVEIMMKHRFQNLKGQHTRVAEYLTEDLKDRNYDTDPFDVVDLDPYGSPSIFLDTAIQSVRDGGLLCVTATDLATMCGKNLEVCFSKYGSMSLKAKYGHEMAIRMVLACLERKANVYGRFIVPILSVQMDFYLRVFVRVYTSKAEIKRSAAKLGLVVQSSGCDSFFIQPLANEMNGVHKCASVQVPQVCGETGKSMRIAGPIWTEPIHNLEFVKTLISMFGKNYKPENGNFDAAKLGAAKIVKGTLVAVSEEVPDAPLYYCLPSLCKILRCSVPPMAKIHGALINAGYRVSQVHCDSNGLKTDAPPEVIWDVLRAWVKKIEPDLDPSKPSKKAAKRFAGSEEMNSKQNARFAILTKEPKISVNFSIPGELLSKLKKRKENLDRISRWTPNPQPNWGPKSRAKGSNKFQTHPKNRNNRNKRRGNGNNHFNKKKAKKN